MLLIHSAWATAGTATKYNCYNNKLKYSTDDGSTWNTITFPEGTFDYQDLELCIKKKNAIVISSGHSEPGIQIKLYAERFRVLIALEEKFWEDLREGDFNILLSFD